MGFVGNPSASPVGPLTPCCGNKCAGHAQWEGSGLWGASGKPAIRNPGSAPPPPPPSTCMRLGLRSPAPHPPQCLGLVFPACLHADIQAGGGRVRRPGQSPEHARGSPGHGLWVLTTTRSQGSTRLLLDAFLGPGKPAYPEVPTGRSQLGGEGGETAGKPAPAPPQAGAPVSPLSRADGEGGRRGGGCRT